VGAWPSVGRDFPRACALAGIEKVTPNDLRRTYASWLVNAGAPLKVVANLLGHSSTRMVDLVYGRVADETQKAWVAKLAMPSKPLGVEQEATGPWDKYGTNVPGKPGADGASWRERREARLGRNRCFSDAAEIRSSEAGAQGRN
jgi:hypothetical protein